MAQETVEPSMASSDTSVTMKDGAKFDGRKYPQQRSLQSRRALKRADVIPDAAPFLLSPPDATDDPGDAGVDPTSTQDWWPYTDEGGTFVAEASTTSEGSSTSQSVPVTASTMPGSSSIAASSTSGPSGTSSEPSTIASSTSSGTASSTSESSPASVTSASKGRSVLSLIVPVAFGVLMAGSIIAWIILARRNKQRKRKARSAGLLAAEDEAFDGDDEHPKNITHILGYQYVAVGTHKEETEKLSLEDEDEKMLAPEEAGDVSLIRGNWTKHDDEDASRPNPYALKRSTELTHAFGWRETLHRSQGDMAIAKKANARGVQSGLGLAVPLGLGAALVPSNIRRRLSGPTESAIYQRLIEAEAEGEEAKKATAGATLNATAPVITTLPGQNGEVALQVAAQEPRSAADNAKPHGLGGVASRIFKRAKAIHPAQTSPSAFKITPRKGDELIAGRAYSDIPVEEALRTFQSPSKGKPMFERARIPDPMPHGGTPKAQLLSPELQPAMFFAPMDGLGLQSPANTCRTLRGDASEPSPDLSMYSDATGMTGMGGQGFSTNGLALIGLRSPGQMSVMPTPRDKTARPETFSAVTPPLSYAARKKQRASAQHAVAFIPNDPSLQPPSSRSSLTPHASAHTSTSVRPAKDARSTASSTSRNTSAQAAHIGITSPSGKPSNAASHQGMGIPHAAVIKPSLSAFDRRNNRKIISTAHEDDTALTPGPSPNGLKRTSAFNGLSSSGTPQIHGETVIFRGSDVAQSPSRTLTNASSITRATAKSSASSATSTLASPLQKRMDLVRKAELKDALGGANLEKRMSNAAQTRSRALAGPRSFQQGIAKQQTKVERMVQNYSVAAGKNGSS